MTQIGILILQHSRELHYNFCMHAIKSSGVYCAGVTFEICIKSSKTSPKKAICDKNEEEEYYFFLTVSKNANSSPIFFSCEKMHKVANFTLNLFLHSQQLAKQQRIPFFFFLLGNIFGLALYLFNFII